MAAVLCRTTLPVRTDPLEAAAPQMMAPWAEVLALLHHLEALAEAGAAFQLVETPGQVAGRRGRRPGGTGEGESRARVVRLSRPEPYAGQGRACLCPARTDAQASAMAHGTATAPRQNRGHGW